MKTNGIYYLPTTDVLWYVTKVEYYEDLYNPAFSIVDCFVESGFYDRVLITADQFNRFVRIGDL